MLTKEKVYKSLDEMPEKFSLEELMDSLILLHKIELGLAQSEKGQLTSDEQLDEKLKNFHLPPKCTPP
jgi:hypothetical protein